MAAFTNKITTANGWNNLGTLLKGAGYSGSGVVSSISILNMDGAVTAYLHASQNGLTAPATTPADGWPIVPGATDPTKAFRSDRGANAVSLDINQTWINTVGAVILKVLVFGS